MRYQRDLRGRLQLDLSDDSNWHEFERWASLICRRFNGQVVERIDGLDQRYWDIDIDGRIVTLHLEHCLGICLFASEQAGDETVQAIGNAFILSEGVPEKLDE